MSQLDWPRQPSEAPLSLWGYVLISVSAALAQVIVVGGVITWIIAVPGAVGFGWLLLHGLRVFRQIALVLCIGSLLFAPASAGPFWLTAFPLLGLILLLLPASREFCSSNSTTELA